MLYIMHRTFFVESNVYIYAYIEKNKSIYDISYVIYYIRYCILHIIYYGKDDVAYIVWHMINLYDT